MILYPVLGRKGWGVRAIAYFDDYYKAVDFVNANIGKRFLYIGESVGEPEPYTPSAEYLEWCRQVDAKRSQPKDKAA